MITRLKLTEFRFAMDALFDECERHLDEQHAGQGEPISLRVIHATCADCGCTEAWHVEHHMHSRLVGNASSGTLVFCPCVRFVPWVAPDAAGPELVPCPGCGEPFQPNDGIGGDACYQCCAAPSYRRLCEENARLRKTIEALRSRQAGLLRGREELARRGRVSAEPRWIPVSEQVPDSQRRAFLSYVALGGPYTVIGTRELETENGEADGWRLMGGGWLCDSAVTHWMPLPNPEAPQPTKET